MNTLKAMREIVPYAATNKENVFGPDGTLLHTLIAATDRGNEFGAGKGVQKDVYAHMKDTDDESIEDSFEDKARQRLVAEGLISAPNHFFQRFNMASAPTQVAFIERLWSTLRGKLKRVASGW